MRVIELGRRGSLGVTKVGSESGKNPGFRSSLRRPPEEAELAGALEPQTDVTFDPDGYVLVADDEDLVRQVLTVCLEGHGFSVLSARDGREAVDLFRQSCDRIGLVVLDMTMPRMGGAEAFREIRQIREDVLVIITSGFDEENTSGELRSQGVSGFLQKPFLAQEFIDKVRQVAGTPGV